MKKIKTALAITLILATCAVATATTDRTIVRRITDLDHHNRSAGAFRALVIGINEYADPGIEDLDTAVSDARAVAEVLKEGYGFTVRTLINGQATKAKIYDALRGLAAAATPNDSLLIYYAGHGELDLQFDSEDGWWIPADARANQKYTYFDNVLVQQAIAKTKARHVLLISDSCYAGTLFGKQRSLPPDITERYYLKMFNEQSRWGLTSGNKTPVSDAGSAGHSLFAYQLLKHLCQNEHPYMSIQELYVKIAPIIGNNSSQTPICRPIKGVNDLGGELVFIRKGRTTAGISACNPFPLFFGPDGDGKPECFTNSLGMKFVRIPAGSFTIGSPIDEPQRDSDEIQHSVTLTRDFFMGTTEVTNAQFVSFLNAVGRRVPSDELWFDTKDKDDDSRIIGQLGRFHVESGYEDHPVVEVSWHGAKAMAEWLSRQESRTYRLPTEAEWEYADRAATTTPFTYDRCLYTDQANYDGNYPLSGCDKGYYRKRTIPVGSLNAPNAWGLHDMHGNVWEWCQDWYGKYPSGSVTDPTGPDGGSYRVLRSGSWGSRAQYCRSAYRCYSNPSSRLYSLGFRLALSPGR